ncbi:GWT1-domain-containing protein [Testicularia cyperi]|uniref:GPI-anchored wall transfer protein 1 n=1 Tax=Testicularia cyperi TaxID=1882483 RepID=A0A317XNE1_9BASI|nr:GWT1-domain-containing protein [Testicularia cyperi]
MATPSTSTSASASYKHLKEAWIADQVGASVHRVNLLGLTLLLSYLLWAAIRATRLRFVSTSTSTPPSHRSTQPSGLASLATALRPLDRLSDWQLEFLILVVPPICGHTLLSNRLVLLNLLLAATIAAVLHSSRTSAVSSQHGKLKAFNGPSLSSSTRKRHWSKKLSDDEDDDDDDNNDNDNDSDVVVGNNENHRSDAVGSLDPRTSLVDANGELPFRVSIDSAADAAHAAAAPPTYYSGPNSTSANVLPATTATLAGTTRAPSPLSGIRTDFASASTSSHQPLPLPLPLPPPPSDPSLLSPEMESHSTFSSPVMMPSRETLPLLGLSHSRDDSDAHSAVSTSSPLSPLARSLVDPRIKLRSAAPEASATQSHSPSSSLSGVCQSGVASQAVPRASSTFGLAAYVRPRPFLTVYRAHMMLVTIISILAVDFPVFPRELSKCESWGTSWMDMGVGAFVFSLGIISALPFLKSPQNRFKSLKGQLWQDAKKCLPLLVLGSIRVIMVKGVEYPEHVTEYGVHWNFFITLAVMPFAATVSRPFSRHLRYSVLGFVLSAAHQVLLSSTWWQEWALSSTVPRDTLASQNKEGITSLPGYLAIFYLGLDLGHYVLPLDPYFAYRKLRKRRLKPKTDKLAMVLASFAILWWAGYAACCLLGLGTSRRLANLPYVLWVAAFNTSFLLGYTLIHLWLLQPEELRQADARFCNTNTATATANSFDTASLTPGIIADLNRHSLLIFLVANLLTGLVNVSIQTMYTPDWIAALILMAYTATCCGVATLLTAKGFRLKL